MTEWLSGGLLIAGATLALLASIGVRPNAGRVHPDAGVDQGIDPGSRVSAGRTGDTKS